MLQKQLQTPPCGAWLLERHPREMGEPEVAAFLTHLAFDRRVSAW